jgi:hypothetical protein
MKLATAGKVSGKIRTTSGSAISGATVKLSGGVLGTTFTLTTQSDGTFATSWIPIGSYSVTSSKSGYTTKSGSVGVTEGDTSSYTSSLSSN